MTKEKKQYQNIGEKLIEYDQPDRLGMYIGDLRGTIGIPQIRLAEGLCSEQHLANIELGNREAGKLLTDALLQRLGKPADLFMCILEDKEVRDYRQRKLIIRKLQNGELEQTERLLMKYGDKKRNILEQQFVEIVKLNLMYLRGTEDKRLYERLLGVLKMTQPKYEITPVRELLLTRNEGYLLMALLQLKEKLYGVEVVEDEWRQLLDVFHAEQYESAERVCLAPFVVHHVAMQEYKKGNLCAARNLCVQMLQELHEEQRTYCQQGLLELAGSIAIRLGEDDREYRFLAEHVTYMRKNFGLDRQELWIPFEEGDNVHSMSMVIKGRREFLGKSRNLLAGPINPATLYRIEEKGSSPQKRVRRYLLEQVGLSGERYDYEVISGRYEDYLLRSKLGRMVNRKQWEDARILLEELRLHVSNSPNNKQYLKMVEACIYEQLPEKEKSKITLEERIIRLWDVLRLTLPNISKDVQMWEDYPNITLSVNEIQAMKQLVGCYRRRGQYEVALQILNYTKRCMEMSERLEESIDLDAYTLCTMELVSILGDLGRYEESNSICQECLRILVQKKNNQRTVRFLYNILWNQEQVLKKTEGEKRIEMLQTCESLLKQTYAAAKLSRDKAMLQHIRNHARDIYGKMALL